jgi:fructokinase
MKPRTTAAPALYAAIEAGGTKFRCELTRGLHQVLAEARISTTAPGETLAQVRDFFTQAAARFGAPAALGIASFGPVDVDTGSPTWGRILATPKALWGGTDLAGWMHRELGCLVAIDTDVNAAARAELEFGAGRGVRSLVYVTVGTGIGGGAIIDGRTLRGLLHPEMGHIRVRRDPNDLEFRGVCPFHGDCLEGLASGPAIVARWGSPLSALASEHIGHSVIGNYLGQLVNTIILVLSAERIVLGGGVLEDPGLLALIRSSASALLNGYLPAERISSDLDGYLALPGLGSRSGLMGALLLARDAVTRT